MDRSRRALRAIPPSIDPFTPKNQELAPNEVLGILAAAGLVTSDAADPDTRVRQKAEVVRGGAPPHPAVPIVVQVSRWDRMKDMIGVLDAFARHVHASRANLVLAGPAVTGVSDDPEGEAVWDETVSAWKGLSASDRARIHLACIPMDDPTENAIVVNALQRHAAVVVQKSLAEGFGLTVAEAMWKTRPVVATAVGGIVDQVIPGETGLLVDDPHDLGAIGAAVDWLLRDPAEAQRLAPTGDATSSNGSSATATCFSTKSCSPKSSALRRTGRRRLHARHKAANRQWAARPTGDVCMGRRSPDPGHEGHGQSLPSRGTPLPRVRFLAYRRSWSR